MTTKRNDPFAGTFVPSKFYRKDKRVQSIMVEINRALYMDEDTGKKSRTFSEIQHVISEFVVAIKGFIKRKVN